MWSMVTVPFLTLLCLDEEAERICAALQVRLYLFSVNLAVPFGRFGKSPIVCPSTVIRLKKMECSADVLRCAQCPVFSSMSSLRFTFRFSFGSRTRFLASELGIIFDIVFLAWFPLSAGSNRKGTDVLPIADFYFTGM
jgi:hypothetical protein